MKHRAITEEEFTAAMRAAVVERGADWVYPRDDPNYVIIDRLYPMCKYSTRDGEPACIVGAALAKIDPELVPPFERNGSAVGVLEEIIGARRASRARWILAARYAQTVQDSGSTWGNALATYEEWLGLAVSTHD
jgi:hypothetical protein